MQRQHTPGCLFGRVHCSSHTWHGQLLGSGAGADADLVVRERVAAGQQQALQWRSRGGDCGACMQAIIAATSSAAQAMPGPRQPFFSSPRHHAS